MIQLPPLTKSATESSSCQFKSTQKASFSNCSGCKSAGCRDAQACTQICTCNANTTTMMPMQAYPNTFLFRAAPSLVYQNLPVLQVPFFAQSTCNVVGCKDCGFEQNINIDEYLKY